MLRRTQPHHFWPIVARIVSSVGVVFAKSFYDAYQAEAARNRAKEPNTTAEEKGGEMTRAEACAILGLTDIPPTGPLLDTHKHRAKERFDKLFDANRAAGNMYLQGKVSGAYRTIVPDPQWDNFKP